MPLFPPGPTGPASGDLAAFYPNPTVAKIQNVAISAAAPSTNDVLTYNGTTWAGAAGGGSGSIPTSLWAAMRLAGP